MCAPSRFAVIIALLRAFFKPESLIFPERGIAPFFRPLRLNLLAPEIVHAALNGRLPNGVGVETLRQTLSVLWSDQKKQLGME